MPEFILRKTLVFVEDIVHEFGPPPALPRRRAAILALVSNCLLYTSDAADD